MDCDQQSCFNFLNHPFQSNSVLIFQDKVVFKKTKVEKIEGKIEKLWLRGKGFKKGDRINLLCIKCYQIFWNFPAHFIFFFLKIIIISKSWMTHEILDRPWNYRNGFSCELFSEFIHSPSHSLHLCLPLLSPFSLIISLSLFLSFSLYLSLSLFITLSLSISLFLFI